MLLALANATIGQVVISGIAIVGFLAAHFTARKAATKVEQIHILVNSQRDGLVTRIETLEEQLRMLRQEPTSIKEDPISPGEGQVK